MQSSPLHNARRALVVDDDEFQRDLLREMLQQAGWQDVGVCAGGEEALASLQQRGVGGYALLLVDLHMPSMDGFQFMQALEATGFGGAVIIVSGQSREVLHSAALVAQLRRFRLLGTLSKPVQPEPLRELLARA